ncbi:MAG: type II toxin-antitoxin system VapC family toxin [Deltaproteobacteria bacterium]|nr:type II toxin-antitoxin system VapC family toxin [Deltaproteobacteria bacterium]
MRLLLDTHIWLWSHLDPDRLSRRVAQALLARDAELWLSPISVWEFLLLAEKGRVSVRGHPRDWVEAALAKVPMHDAQVNLEVALCSRAIRTEHDDPADRFLAATAAVYDLTLVTDDKLLLRGKGFRTLSNRG